MRTVAGFAMVDTAGNVVPSAILAHASLKGGSGGAAVLVPHSALVRGQTCTVSFAATLQDAGAALQKTWSFTTRP